MTNLSSQSLQMDIAPNWVKRAMQDPAVEVYSRKLRLSDTAADADTILNALQRQVLVNMDEQASSKVLAASSAYYKEAPMSFCIAQLTASRLCERLSWTMCEFKWESDMYFADFLNSFLLKP